MNIGYKKLQNDYIAELEILGKTNENRDDIADPQYAKYRTSKVKVLKIFKNGKRGIKIIKQMNGLHDVNFVYTTGEEMHVSNYDEDVNEVCSQGIHYFKTPFQAKMWNLSLDNYTGKYMEWYDNGTTQCEEEYKDGKREGKYIDWYEDGTTRYEGEFKDGKRKGKWTGWYENGNKWYEGEYKDGKEEGKWIGWWENGNKKEEGEYKDGKRKGKWIWWGEDGNKIYEKNEKEENRIEWWYEGYACNVQRKL